MTENDFDERLLTAPPKTGHRGSGVGGLYQLDGVTHAILARNDGYPLAVVPEGSHGDIPLSAVLAALHGTAEMAMQEAEGGTFTEVIFGGEQNEIL